MTFEAVDDETKQYARKIRALTERMQQAYDEGEDRVGIVAKWQRDWLMEQRRSTLAADRRNFAMLMESIERTGRRVG